VADRITCTKCGRSRPEPEFFKLKTGHRDNICKDCLTMYIDNRKPETFTWILEKFDVPYIEKKWVQLCNETYKKNPGSFGPKSVIGRYLRAMNMVQYKQYTYADSDKLNFADKKQQQESEAAIAAAKEKEEELKAKLERGEITEAQYNTLSAGTASSNTTPEFEIPNALPQYQIDESVITDSLTDDDIQFLMLKWGTVYTPSQWIAMETMYKRYSNEYELNVDREEVLKKMCKTSLKMDEALDTGDVNGYKSLATVFDQLRKSGKFTEAQNKEDKQRYLDSIGELIALCEREGGPIEQLPDPDEYPQDKIDFTIRDLKSYTYGLVTNELGLGDLIESYIEKLEKAEEEGDIDLDRGLITSSEELAADALSDDEAEEFQMFLENEIEKDAEKLLESIGEG